MLTQSPLLTLLLTTSAAALTTRYAAPPTNLPPAFFLAGDSMTAVQAANGGGYGTGFLSFLSSPAWGINYGHNGATTVSFVAGGDWANVISSVKGAVGKYSPFVPIMFGANDQKAAANISLAQYQTNLQNLATDVKKAGGTPILLAPMSRRNFLSNNIVNNLLADQRTYTIYAAGNTSSQWIDFNTASIDYLEAIGNAAAQTYDLSCTDQTHLNDWGSVVFGRMLADLLLGHAPVGGGAFSGEEKYFEKWFVKNETLSGLIWDGVWAQGGQCPLA